MKILFYVSEDIFPVNNGVTVAISGLALSLSKRVEVYIYNYKIVQLYKLDASEQLVKQPEKSIYLNFDLVICSPILSIRDFLFKSKVSIKHKKLIGLVSDNYTYVLWRHILVSCLVKQITFSDIKSFFKIPLVYIAESIIASKTDALIVQSKVEERIYSRYFIKSPRIFVLPNGIQFTVSQNEITSLQREGVGFVASFSNVYMKVARWFIDNVWLNVISNNPDIKLHLLGNNSEKLLNYVEKKYPFASYSVVTEKYYENIQDFYLQRLIVVSPIFKNFGLINKTVEAMYCGCIVVGDKGAFNGLDDFKNGTHGHIVEGGNNFAKKILSIYETKNEDIGLRAHDYIAESLSWDLNANKILEYLNNFETKETQN